MKITPTEYAGRNIVSPRIARIMGYQEVNENQSKSML